MNFFRKPKPETFDNVIDGLKKVYKSKLLPLEKEYHFHDFHSSVLDDSDFESKPIVLLVGQYSTGKTSFIRYLLEEDFPGMQIGPEPTTDSFIAVMHGDDKKVIPGNVLVVDQNKNFKTLAKFGNIFLNKLQCSQLPSKRLEILTFVDTPGILSGKKQTRDRGYNYAEVIEWFADKCDMILLLFDAHQLDISDEFKQIIEVLKKNDEKIRIVLNKADMVDSQSLLRVYGALMWSLSKVLNTPEVVRVYMGSFWTQPFQNDSFRKLFEKESKDLLYDLQSLHRNSSQRKLNDLIKRARLAKVHAYIISEMRKKMPLVFFKEENKRKIIENLDRIYLEIQFKYPNISSNDLPNISNMRRVLEKTNFDSLKPINSKLIENLEKMLTEDVPILVKMLPKEEFRPLEIENTFEIQKSGPFSTGRWSGINTGINETEWVIEKTRKISDEIFANLNPINGKLTPGLVQQEWAKTRLPNLVLNKIWYLSDQDKDNMLNCDEWALANYLVKLKTEGYDLPDVLPDHLKPPLRKKINSILS